jgi:hypothetical protein
MKITVFFIIDNLSFNTTIIALERRKATRALRGIFPAVGSQFGPDQQSS